MQHRHLPSPDAYSRFTTDELRAAFLATDLFTQGKVDLLLTDLDRAVCGSAVPTTAPLTLPNPDQLRAGFFCERRELGIINIGAPGAVTVDGQTFEVGERECVYVGRGARSVEFRSKDGAKPAAFYLLSYPAHTSHPTTHASQADANIVDLGSGDTANERRIVQYIHESGIKSCQLVMGYTELATGSVWNTMPPHTHGRRTEIYCYFDVPDDHRVLHLMGKPEETRPLWIANRQLALSPSWSIHAGSGTSNYRFIWGMGGENQRFDDMDPAPITSLR